MCSLCVASIRPLYHLENTVVLKSAFSQSVLDCQGSNIFTMCPLSSSAGGIPIGRFHLNIENYINRYL
jgi:hypothetical protein